MKKFLQAGVCLLSLSALLSPHAEQTEQQHGDWTLGCESAEGGADQGCILFQNLILKDDRQPVLQFAVGRAPDDEVATVIITLPLGISLPPGITVRIDEGDDANFPVERCEPDGCQAGMKLRQQTIDRLRGGNKITITFYDGERQPIYVPLSLKGFSKGMDALLAKRGQN